MTYLGNAYNEYQDVEPNCFANACGLAVCGVDACLVNGCIANACLAAICFLCGARVGVFSEEESA